MSNKIQNKKKTDPSQTKAQHRKEISAEQFIRIKKQNSKKNQNAMYEPLSLLFLHIRDFTNMYSPWMIDLVLQIELRDEQ
jgi:hypothetical protein